MRIILVKKKESLRESFFQNKETSYWLSLESVQWAPVGLLVKPEKSKTLISLCLQNTFGGIEPWNLCYLQCRFRGVGKQFGGVLWK